MNVAITGLLDRGDVTKERIVMKVAADTDIGDFIMIRSAMVRDGVTTGVNEVHWFANQEVAAGDTIVLYTKSGSPNTKVNKNGTSSYFYYWGHRGALWSDASHAPVLLSAPEWQAYLPDDWGPAR